MRAKSLGYYCMNVSRLDYVMRKPHHDKPCIHHSNGVKNFTKIGVSQLYTLSNHTQSWFTHTLERADDTHLPNFSRCTLDTRFEAIFPRGMTIGDYFKIIFDDSRTQRLRQFRPNNNAHSVCTSSIANREHTCKLDALLILHFYK